MKLPVRDITALSAAEIADKTVYALRRRLGRPPELAQVRRLVASGSLPDGPGPRVLVVSPRDWAMHLHWESLIALALTQRGAQVTQLGCPGGLEICDHNNCYRSPPMPCGSCTRYSRATADAYGLTRLEMAFGPPDPWPELDHLSIDELFEQTTEGLELGRLVRTAAMWFNMTTRVHDDPLAPATVRAFLRSGRRVVAAMRRHLDEHPPDVVLVLNGLLLFESILWELCKQRDIPVVTYEAAFVPGTLVAARNGVAGYYDQRAWWDEWSQRPLRPEEAERLSSFIEARRTGGQTADRYWRDAQFEPIDRRTPGRMAVLFTNLTWDTAVIGKERAFSSIHHWVSHAITAFAQRPEHELVVRIHPAERKLRGKTTREPVADLIAREHPVLPPNVRVIGPDDPTSSYTLMEQADLGLVFTSTTGIELAMAGTPTLVAGETHYRGLGFTLDADDPDDFDRLLDEVLADPQRHAPDVELARRYAYLFLFASPMELPLLAQPRPGVPVLRTSDLADLAPGRCPDLDRLCDGIIGEGDFRPQP